ncbi:MAG: hypothetical protein AB7K37_09685 [Cyclobacteriaceae bacterium]
MATTSNINKGVGFPRVIFYGILTELSLIIVQVFYLQIYTYMNPGAPLAFTTDYMITQGFYVFQIVGFVVYVIVAFLIRGKIADNLIGKMIAFLAAAAVAEVAFYLFIQASYQGAFIYSILDKFMAAVFGLILYYYTHRNSQIPDQAA